MLSKTEENYIKTIFNLDASCTKNISTTLIANEIDTKASSVTDMLKKLADKNLINYTKYKGASLTEKGKKTAVTVVRNHRIWEVFLVNHLQYSWDEVHDLAEQLEHIKSDTLIDRLDAFLNFPEFDPHGEPIPDKNGKIRLKNTLLLSQAKPNLLYKVASVKDDSSALLQFLDKHHISLNSEFTVVEKFDFDNSITIKLNETLLTLSNKVCKNVFVIKK